MEKLKILPCYHFLLEPVHWSGYLWTGSKHFWKTSAICSLLHAASPLF